MSTLFHPDSKMVKVLTLIGNLILVNLLWLITSLPVVTIGASTTALYAVVFKFADDTDDEVFKPYFRAFAANFKLSTMIWIPICMVMVILAVDAYYLLSHADSSFTTVLWIPFFILLAVVSVVMAYAFPQLARFETDLRSVLHNSVLMFFLHFFQSVCMVVLNLIPWAMMLMLPDVFAQTSIFWLMFGGSAIAYCNARVLLKIFKKHQPEELYAEET